MKYVIVEKETGTQHIFDTFAKALEYIDEWCGELEMSEGPEIQRICRTTHNICNITNMNTENKYTQLCVWPGTIVEDHEIEEFEDWVQDTFDTRIKYHTQIKTKPGYR